MAALTFNRYILECDGCQERHGEPDGHRSATEMRAAAYAAGWRFPAMIKADGTPGHSSSDVGPACLPMWRPRRWGQRRSGRYLYQAEAPIAGTEMDLQP